MDLQEVVAIERAREDFGTAVFGPAPLVLDVQRRERSATVLYENELQRQQYLKQHKRPTLGVTGSLIFWERSVEKFSDRVRDALLETAKAVRL